MRIGYYVIVTSAFLLLLEPGLVFSHCDTLDGPVITDAKKALETANVNLVLIWVQKDDEPEVRKAFQETLSMRTISPRAKEFADLYFFETLIRIHREGEGASYTGLKPAGQDLGPAIVAADEALKSDSVDSARELLLRTVQEGLEQRFQEVKTRQNYEKNDVAAGREYISAYVQYIHYVEGLYELASKNGDQGTSGHDHQ